MTHASEADARLAEGLRQAHRRVAVLELDEDTRTRVLQRLLAIGDAAKRDTTRAAARLERFLAELDAGGTAPGEDVVEQP